MSVLRPRIVPVLSIASLTLASLVAPGEASAQFIQRFTLRGEAGVGTMLSAFQRNTDTTQYEGNTKGFDLAIQGTGRIGFTLIDPLVLQVSAANWFFPNGNQGTGRVVSYTGGIRLEPRIGHAGRLFVDGNVGWSFTGDDDRFTWDVGVGFEFQLTRAIGLGPVVRLASVTQRTSLPTGLPEPFPQDAYFWSAGLSLALRVPPDEVIAPVDTDGDGVFDPDDLCPTVPAGAHPDPNRRGCPIPDTDGDGVLDPDDVCPTVPMGDHPDPARRGCPAQDSDHDGVLDPDDLCPTVPAGDHPDPARRGCPLGDRDHDGVLDPDDQCPDEPAGTNPDPAHPGCPLRGPVLAAVEGGMIRIFQQVNFATNSDRIVGDQSFAVLDAVISILGTHPEITHVNIQGHTDNHGSAAHNRSLSERRANAVMRYLVEHHIPAGNLEAHGFGPTMPLESNATSEGRARNRRVEFHIGNANDASPAGAVPAASAPAPAADHHHRHHGH